MLENLVRFKGNKNGIQIIFKENALFDELYTALIKKLETSRDFFSSAIKTTIQYDSSIFTKVQMEKISNLFNDYSLIVKQKLNFSNLVFRGEKKIEKKIELEGYETSTLIINKTLRGGKRIIYDGAVLLIGDINPGAEIVAGKDIIIYGFCRGLLHAGAFGDRNAKIIANKLQPIQLRIADVIARVPDNGVWHNNKCYGEIAYIQAEQLIIKPLGN